MKNIIQKMIVLNWTFTIISFKIWLQLETVTPVPLTTYYVHTDDSLKYTFDIYKH
jgi:hypothetical protein